MYLVSVHFVPVHSTEDRGRHPEPTNPRRLGHMLQTLPPGGAATANSPTVDPPDRRPPFKPILSNAETFVPKRKYAPPTPPPTTPKVQPVQPESQSETAAGPSSGDGEQSLEQFMKVMKEFFKNEVIKQKPEAREKDDLDEVFSVE
ncbi:unnamed protein product [Cylicocyclus nassatus]|uniref:Uncharacterized protein n=1 Tax=Cylicocyclus nassatus TaxID=53992 RepID=A0AA36DPR2_CYLNA|nr:unnamed protein product [Cylicocyclus nassatus]